MENQTEPSQTPNSERQFRLLVITVSILSIVLSVVCVVVAFENRQLQDQLRLIQSSPRKAK